MKVRVNNREKIVPVGCTAKELTEILGIKNNDPVALAIGEEVLSEEKWASTELKDNDKITIIRATCGG